MKRRIGFVSAAVVLALIGTIAVYSYGRRADQRATAGGRAVTVLVAAKQVPAGTSWADVVKGKYAKAEQMPAGSTPSSALSSVTTAGLGSNAVTQAAIASGQILLRESFGSAVPQTGALALPNGMIAVSVSLPGNADVAGYVGPKSQVVIFQTAQVTKVGTTGQSVAGQQLTMTKTLVPRATVLATSQAAPTNVTGAATANATTTNGSVLVTLALSQSDSQRVILGQKVGDLYLGLLSSASRVSSSDPGVLNVGVLRPAPIYVK